jgi:hypothetical protein
MPWKKAPSTAPIAPRKLLALLHRILLARTLNTLWTGGKRIGKKAKNHGASSTSSHMVVLALGVLDIYSLFVDGQMGGMRHDPKRHDTNMAHPYDLSTSVVLY